MRAPEPAKPVAATPAQKSVRVLWPYMRHEWLALVVAAASTVLLTVAQLATPFPLKYALDNLIFVKGTHTLRSGHLSGSDLRLLVLLAAAVLGIALVNAIATYQSDLRLMLAGERIIHELRLAVYTQLQRLRISFHYRTPTGDLVTRVTADVDAIGDMFATNIGAVVSSGLLVIGMLIVSFVIDPVLALISVGVAPLLALFSWWFRSRQRAASSSQRKKEGEVASLSGEILAAMREVQAFGSEEYEQARLRAKSEERWRAGIASAKLEARFSSAIDITGALGVALVLAVGVWRVRAGHLTPGSLTVMITYATQLYKPLSSIAKYSARIQKALARGDRIAEVLGADEVLEEVPNAYHGGAARGEIQFDRVTFGYTPDRIALNDVSLLVHPGQKIAVIGHSGAGKSTIAALIARFYDPQGGRVLLDGRDVRECSLRWLRSQVGLVLQESVLFTGTVAENIAYGIRDADRQAVEEAARRAGAHDFISQMPDGYDTVLGQRGVGLSGGQRQRIAIARTILRNPAILVLDEPTTGLDTQSEAEVMQGLEALMHGRTTVMITHSPALARTAQRVIEIGGGRIKRQGTPTELAADLRNIVRAERARRMTVERSGLPPDPALPQLARLLDVGEMTDSLARSLGRPALLRDVRIRYVRYRPRQNLVVHYEVEIGHSVYNAVAIIAAQRDLSLWVADAAYRRLAELVDGRAPTATPLSYDAELNAMIQWLPLDIGLPALAESAASLRKRLHDAGVDVDRDGGEPLLLSYRPRRRAVCRLEHHVLKVHGERDEFEAAAAAAARAARIDGVPVVRPEALLDQLQVVCEPFVDGVELESHAAAREAGAVLAGLQRAPVADSPPFSHADQLRAAAAAADNVTAIVPEVEGRLQALLQTLELTRPDDPTLVLAHGNFHERQLLDVHGTATLLDVQHLCAASPALDPANYIARQVNGGADDVALAAELADELVEGLGSRPRALSWYLSTTILRRAQMPFRDFTPDWPSRIETMVAQAEDALHV